MRVFILTKITVGVYQEEEYPTPYKHCLYDFCKQLMHSTFDFELQRYYTEWVQEKSVDLAVLMGLTVVCEAILAALY